MTNDKVRGLAVNAFILAGTLAGWVARSGKDFSEILAWTSGIALINCVWLWPANVDKDEEEL